MIMLVGHCRETIVLDSIDMIQPLPGLTFFHNNKLLPHNTCGLLFPAKPFFSAPVTRGGASEKKNCEI